MFGFGGDAVLFFAADVLGDGSGDYASGQASSFGFELIGSFAGPGDLWVGAAVLVIEFDTEACAHQFGGGVGHSDGGVVPLDGLFDGFDGQVPLLAVSPP